MSQSPPSQNPRTRTWATARSASSSSRTTGWHRRRGLPAGLLGVAFQGHWLRPGGQVVLRKRGHPVCAHGSSTFAVGPRKGQLHPGVRTGLVRGRVPAKPPKHVSGAATLTNRLAPHRRPGLPSRLMPLLDSFHPNPSLLRAAALTGAAPSGRISSSRRIPISSRF